MSLLRENFQVINRLGEVLVFDLGGPWSAAYWTYTDGLVQTCSISIAKALEILQSYSKSLIYGYWFHQAMRYCNTSGVNYLFHFFNTFQLKYSMKPCDASSWVLVTTCCLTKMQWSSVWLPWSSLEMLKLAFNISSDNQGSPPDDLSLSVLIVL